MGFETRRGGATVRRGRAIHVLLGIAIVAGVLAAPTFAQTSDRRTFFTFSGPISIPGVTLPAGRYLFRIIDPSTSGRIVQVLSDNGEKGYGLFFSIPAERLDPAENPEVRFMETPSELAPAIRTWWYPGQRTGWEFIYPKEQARRLARSTAEPVLTTKAETATPEQTKAGELERIASTGQETPVVRDSPPAPGVPTGPVRQGEVAAASIPIAEATVPTTGQQAGTARRHLPQTASSLPLVGLVGLLFLAGAASLRLYLTTRR